MPGPDSRIKERIKERKRNVDKFGLGVQFFFSRRINRDIAYILFEKREQREVEPGTFGIETLKKRFIICNL